MIYEYKCDCEHITEKSMKMTDEHPKFVKCEKCGKDAYRHFVLSAIIPPHMRAGESDIRYDRLPRSARKYH